MKIAIEAQRIFRPNKHGMDFVALEAIRCLQKLDTKNEYFIFTGEGGDRCLEETPNMHIETLRCPTRSGSSGRCRAPWRGSNPTCCTARATRRPYGAGPRWC